MLSSLDCLLECFASSSQLEAFYFLKNFLTTFHIHTFLPNSVHSSFLEKKKRNCLYFLMELCIPLAHCHSLTAQLTLFFQTKMLAGVMILVHQDLVPRQ